MFRKLTLTLTGVFTFLLFSALTIAQDMDSNTSLVTKDTRSNLQIVNDMYNSFAKGDIPAVLVDMAPNIEWNESENFPYADGNPYIGPDAVVNGVFKRLGEEWEYWKLTDQVLYESQNNEIIVTGHYNAKYKKTGKEINAQFVHIFWIENGKVLKFQQYADTYQVNKAMQ